MAGPINVVCGGCQTKYQVPPVLAGKKIRCKNCSATIAIPSAAKAVAKPIAKPTAKAVAKPIAAKPSPAEAAGLIKPAEKPEEWGKITGYDVIHEKDLPRCPHCAHDMDEGEIVCLNCGYNTLTRERLDNKVLEATTGGDYFLWLLPGIICLILALFFLFMAQSIFTRFPALDFLDSIDFYYSNTNKGVPVYLAVFFAFDIWGLGYFSFRRLVLNPHPPDQIKKREKPEDDE